jgi:hypothetical protein
MGMNGSDDDAPAADAVLALDAPERVARVAKTPVGDAPDHRSGSERRLSRRVVSRPRARLGRPPHLTSALQEKLVAAVRAVGWINPAARQCGIPEPVVREWLARGRGQHTRPRTPQFAAFAAEVDAAQAEWEASKLALIDMAARTKTECWNAAAWALERHAPERYGRRTAVEHTGTITVMEVRGLLLSMIGILERYVPVERRETEFRNLLAEGRKLGGGTVVGLPPPRES